MVVDIVAGPAQVVRCLACGASYQRPLPSFSLARSYCPTCDYVGWAVAE